MHDFDIRFGSGLLNLHLRGLILSLRRFKTLLARLQAGHAHRWGIH